MKLGHRLRHARKKRGLTQEQLATAAATPELPISQAAISALEQRDSETSVYVFALARALKINPEWLQTGAGESGLDADAWVPDLATNYGISIKLEEAEAVKRLQAALPRWRAYVLGLAMVDNHETQKLMLDTMTQTVSDARVHDAVSIAPHAAARQQDHELARVSERTGSYNLGRGAKGRSKSKNEKG